MIEVHQDGGLMSSPYTFATNHPHPSARARASLCFPLAAANLWLMFAWQLQVVTVHGRNVALAVLTMGILFVGAHQKNAACTFACKGS